MEEITPLWAEEDGSVTGYMCLVDFEYELGGALGGNIIYPSIEDCRANRACVATDGIVEVTVKFSRVVQDPVDD